MKHAIEYPAMSHGLVKLRMATSNTEMDKLREEFANDMEASANLSPSYYNFAPLKTDTWESEYWLIHVRDDVAGYIEIQHGRQEKKAGLSVAVKTQYRDGFVAMKALALILRYMFDVLGLRKLETDCYGYNVRAQKIYRSFLVQEGVRREAVYWAGKYWDKHLYGLLSSEWNDRRGKVYRILR